MLLIPGFILHSFTTGINVKPGGYEFQYPAVALGWRIALFAGLQMDRSKEFRLGAEGGFRLGAEGGLRGEADVCGVSGEQAGRRLKGSAEQFSAGARPRLVLSSST